MTKGNFEARCERAQRKKAAARAEKEERQLGLRVDPDVMLAKLFRHDPDAAVFLSLPDSQMQSEGQKLCWLHFHEEACENRRCKWSHRKDMRVCLARVVRLCLMYVRVLFLMLRSQHLRVYHWKVTHAQGLSGGARNYSYVASIARKGGCGKSG